MFVEFETHPDGGVVMVNISQRATVCPEPTDPTRALIRFSDGLEVVVRETKDQVMAKLNLLSASISWN